MFYCFQIKLYHCSEWIWRLMVLYASNHWSKPASWRDSGLHPFLQTNIYIIQLLFRVNFISIPQDRNPEIPTPCDHYTELARKLMSFSAITLRLVPHLAVSGLHSQLEEVLLYIFIWKEIGYKKVWIKIDRNPEVRATAPDSQFTEFVANKDCSVQ